MRPILVGMNNPLSSDPALALYPWPQGSTGYRIWQMLYRASCDTPQSGCSRLQYARCFDRVNLCPSQVWSPAEARATAPALRERLHHPDQESVIFGWEVWSILRLGARPPVGEPMDLGDRATTYFFFHPSGRSLWYNQAENRAQLGSVLARMLRESASAGI